MVKALQNNDTATLEGVASSISEETFGAWYGDDIYDYYDETELSDRRMNELKDNLEDLYNMDTRGIKKVVSVVLKITVKGSKKSSTYNVNNLYMVKENSGWKVFYGNLNY